MKLIFFDLEGPLAPQDNAYELMKLFPRGGEVFEAISRYDDLLTLEGREGYEPGDTLALILPFLIYHDISEKEIGRLAQKAGLVPGAQELVAHLKGRGWGVFCISTSYEQYARRIASRVGIPSEKVACTAFPLEALRKALSPQDLAPVARVEGEVLASLGDEKGVKERLDRFFWKEIKGTPLGQAMERVRPMGGGRKVEALKRLAAQHRETPGNLVAVGDSITDFKMLQAVKEAGGLAVAFNANEYALPYATMGLASTSLADLEVALRAWEEGGRAAAEKAVRERERLGGSADRGHFHWLLGRRDWEGPLALHNRIRRLVREEAAKLG